MNLGSVDFRQDVIGDKHWFLQDVAPHVSVKLKRVFGGIRAGQRPPYILKDTPDRAVDLEWFLSRYPMTVSDVARTALDERLETHKKKQAALEVLRRPDWQPGLVTGFNEGESPHSYQVRAAEMLRNNGRLLLLDDVGLGKTVSALASISDGWGLPAAIIVQPHLSSQWVTQYIERFTGLRAYEVKDRKVRNLPEADIYVFRYSNIEAWATYAETLGCRTVVFDEIQELRHGRGTGKGMGARAFVDAADAVLGLTATPIYNYGGEIWNVVEFVAPGALGTWEEFLMSWCKQDASGGKAIVADPQALGAYLYEEGIALRRTCDDEEVSISLPPLSKNVLEVAWNEGDAEADHDLRRQLAMRVLNGSFHDRGMAARELDIMLRQETGIAKARAVAAYVRMLAEAGEPLIMAGWHREVYRIWNEVLADLKPAMFTGSETQSQKRAAREAFLQGDTNIMIMSLRSGAGLDGLQARAAHVVFGELDWSPQVHVQVIGRLHRQGQANPVTAHYLHVEGGSDPVIMQTLGLKASQSHGILNPFENFTTATPIDKSRMRALAEAVMAEENPHG